MRGRRWEAALFAILLPLMSCPAEAECERSDAGIAACTAAIDSGALSGSALAKQYLERGDAYLSIRVDDSKTNLYEGRALDDYNEAIKLNASNGDAFRSRG